MPAAEECRLEVEARRAPADELRRSPAFWSVFWRVISFDSWGSSGIEGGVPMASFPVGWPL